MGEQRRENAQDDVEDGQQPGEESGGVTESDDDDVRGEPEIGVEHSTHHFHRVAAQGKVMGDEQRHEAGQGSDETADAEPVNALDDQSEDQVPQPMKMAEE